MRNKVILFTLGLMSFVLVAHATVVGTILNPSDANPDQVVGNKASMVANSTMVNNHYVITVLKKAVEHNDFIRIAAVKLDSIPVLVAISKTSIKNKDFVHVLRDNGDVRIGKKIMELSPTVTYANSAKSTITVHDLDNPTIKKYLMNIGYSGNKILVVRSIIFTRGSETMTLIEYIIPNDID